MDRFDAPLPLTLLFAALTLLVAGMDVLLVRLAAPTGRAKVWTIRAGGLAIAWLALHASIAESGILEGAHLPPPVGLYLLVNVAVGIGVAFSPVGGRLARLPIPVLIGLHAFRLPLEVLLHALYDAGVLPVQMTWSGRNLDVVTGLLALGLAFWGRWRRIPRSVALGFNLLGLGLLVNVVTIAMLSAPLPFRQFLNDPPALLIYQAPYTWIASVHVWTALVGHLLLFRAIAVQDGE